MKIMDFAIAALIGLVVGVPAYFLVDSYLLTEERFQTNIEIVQPINSGFNSENNDIFTDSDRIDYSSGIELNTERNSQPISSN